MTKRQKKMMTDLLTMIWAWWQDKNYAPSLGDIAIELQWSRSRAQRLTDQAEELGLIVSDSKKARSIRPVGMVVQLPPIAKTLELIH